MVAARSSKAGSRSGRMAGSSAIQDDDAGGLPLCAAADEVDAPADLVAGVVGAIPLELRLAGREDAIRERADPAAGDVVDVHLHSALLRDTEAHGGDATAHD